MILFKRKGEAKIGDMDLSPPSQDALHSECNGPTLPTRLKMISLAEEMGISTPALVCLCIIASMMAQEAPLRVRVIR
jgi:hypothetical protein